MPTKSYALHPGGPERIQVSWRRGFRDVAVSCDGQALGTIATAREVRKGRAFPLADGSTLTVRMARGAFSNDLALERDGQSLPGSAADPLRRIRTAAGVAYFIGGVSIVVGLIAQLAQVEILQALGLGLVSAFVGVVFLGLGALIARRSAVALGIAVALLVIDGLLSMVTAVQVTGRAPTGAVIVRVFLLIPMTQAFGAISELKRQPAPAG